MDGSLAGCVVFSLYIIFDTWQVRAARIPRGRVVSGPRRAGGYSDRLRRARAHTHARTQARTCTHASTHMHAHARTHAQTRLQICCSVQKGRCTRPFPRSMSLRPPPAPSRPAPHAHSCRVGTGQTTTSAPPSTSTW